MKTTSNSPALYEGADDRLAILVTALRGLGDLLSAVNRDLHLVSGDGVGCLVGVLAGQIDAARTQANEELQSALAHGVHPRPSSLRLKPRQPASPAQN